MRRSAAAKRVEPTRAPYAIGDISRREDEPAMCQECKRCGTPRPQQLMSRGMGCREEWALLPCTSCPLDLRGTR